MLGRVAGGLYLRVWVGGGLNDETEHFCDCLRVGAAHSPAISHERSRQTIAMMDQSRTALRLPPLG
ncbi:hypothetical protein [Pararobbsia alpina]|nr:hypothetical protein [Pararobbsia alpina]